MQLKNNSILLWLACSFIIFSCANEKKQRYDVLKSLLENFESRTALYYKSKKNLPHPITLPISRNTFKNYDQFSAYNIDSLITRQDIAIWNSRIKNSSPIMWDSTKLSEIKIVKEEPAYFEDPIPDPDKTPYPIEQVLYVSTPFFNDDYDKALIFLSKNAGVLNSSRWYYIMGKNAKSLPRDLFQEDDSCC